MKQKDIDFPDCWEEVKPLEWLHLLKIRNRLMKQPGTAQSLGMNSVLYSVAESGIFGNADATDDTLLLRVMMKLLDDKQRADEMIRNLKQ